MPMMRERGREPENYTKKKGLSKNPLMRILFDRLNEHYLFILNITITHLQTTKESDTHIRFVVWKRWSKNRKMDCEKSVAHLLRLAYQLGL